MQIVTTIKFGYERSVGETEFRFDGGRTCSIVLIFVVFVRGLGAFILVLLFCMCRNGW